MKYKRISFDIKYRPEIESGKYSVETRDGKAVRIVCWDKKSDRCIIGLIVQLNGIEVLQTYLPDGRTGHKFHCDDLFIVTDEAEEHPITMELKEHLASLSEEERKKVWTELEEWYETTFVPVKRDWVEEFRECIEAMSPEEFEEKWRQVKERCGEEEPDELTEFEKALYDDVYSTVVACYGEPYGKGELKWIIKGMSRDLLAIARKDVEKEIISSRYSYEMGKKDGKDELLASLPKWKKAERDIDDNRGRICLSHGDMDYPHYTNDIIYPGEYYLDFEDLKKLPKEE